MVKSWLVNTQELLDHAKPSATDALKNALKRAILKTTETTGDLTGYKITDKISKVSRSSPQNGSETTTNDEKIPKER